MTREIIHIYDFGSQYTQLIARRIRELNVYCKIYAYYQLPELTKEVKGIIFSGGPSSVLSKNAPIIDFSKYRKKIPILGICYGAQLIAKQAGGNIVISKREYGAVKLTFVNTSIDLMEGIDKNAQVWMSHGDTINTLPKNFTIVANTQYDNICAYQIDGEHTYGLQFHPEVTHSIQGKNILKNFIVNICHCKQQWTSSTFIETTIKELKEKIGNDKVIMALSGGIDSSVAALLLKEAIGKNLHCIFIDNGLLREGEFKEVLSSYHKMNLNIKGIEARNEFYSGLKNISNPESKRKIIGKIFIQIFEREAQKIKDVKWLGQGTIYPDVIESGSVNGPSVTIKSHHNVGGIPEKMQLKLIEPLRNLFKDEVRCAGKILGIDTKILERHPFPGPGLAIRILGKISLKKVQILQKADAIFIEALKENNLYERIWQAGAILLPLRSVGIMGDKRTYQYVISLRAVTSVDGMTANWYPFSPNFLKKISTKIINQVVGINRVVYDISSKPPSTIEWE